ncbi:histidine kinase [Edwardsiella hoshinae]|uniref:histidine kinase n=1 Tax=Edwardsiella hoshinae TaxID=93378 RepID=A0A376DFE2_9GAMM|nr:PhnD/SsuA/transferrin family substrate-binding protein [Edwardsiella hoshinae]AOV96873.1 histidine kinase [Edwardsiella hoshinae]QPR27269.1 PhnD/SsuA/transferrin family substrate-binding protein [Edwardsiella hoshinae]STC87926.1 Sensor protein fixL [Edwardsiella hoshinae]
MTVLLRLYWLLLFLVCLPPAQATSPQPVTIGVLATRGTQMANSQWQPLIAWLNQRLPAYHFQLQPYDISALDSAVRQRRLDFVITNPGQAVTLGRHAPLSWLATLRSPLRAGNNNVIGSALIVRRDSRLRHLADLHGKRISAVSPQAFGGYQTLLYRLARDGYDYRHFFGQIRFAGFPLDALIYRLRDAETDAIIVPVCQLETMASEGLIDAKDFRVIDNIAPADFQCQSTTLLYPNWSFARTERASATLAKQVAAALLALPEHHPAARAANSLGWSAPESSYSIEQFYRQLEETLPASLTLHALRWLQANQAWLWGALSLLLLLTLYHLWLEWRFQRTQRRLLDAEADLNRKRLALEHAQRVAIVGELGTSLAHELNQPLEAIKNYADGCLHRAHRQAEISTLIPALGQISQQVTRADAIVKRLRRLIRRAPQPNVVLAPHSVMDDTLTLLAHELRRHAIVLTCHVEGVARSDRYDAIGLQQLLLNLLKNAIEAVASQPEPRHITLVQRYLAQAYQVTIADNGPGLPQDGQSVQQAFFTTKPDGLGLGLSICQQVTEALAGTLTLANRPEGGCLVTLTLPYPNQEVT